MYAYSSNCGYYILTEQHYSNAYVYTFVLHIGIGVKKFCKGAIVFNKFWVATLLYNPPSIHYNNQITVRQVCQAMSCQDAYLENIPILFALEPPVIRTTFHLCNKEWPLSKKFYMKNQMGSTLLLR